LNGQAKRHSVSVKTRIVPVPAPIPGRLATTR
jgi:hypothetical protein